MRSVFGEAAGHAPGWETPQASEGSRQRETCHRWGSAPCAAPGGMPAGCAGRRAEDSGRGRGNAKVKAEGKIPPCKVEKVQMGREKI